METIIQIITATLAVSLISLIGLFTFVLSKKFDKILLALVALSAGALIGGSFFHLIPEALELTEIASVSLYVIVGFVLFLLIEKILHWRHCHKHRCKIHTFAYMNLFGDVFHNFLDGLVIAASFMTNTATGIATTLAVALHEIPQEIGDFGVLLHGGIKKGRALFLNFITALTALLGGLIGYFLSRSDVIKVFLLPFAAGGFLYIAASDLIPEIRKEIEIKKMILNFIMFLIGIVIMYLMVGVV